MCLHTWAFRRSAWLYNRFHVRENGETPFEMILGRQCKGKIAPFGRVHHGSKEFFLGKDRLSKFESCWYVKGSCESKANEKMQQSVSSQSIVGVSWSTRGFSVDGH